MPPRHILIVYGSTQGQTAKIAARMADHLAESGDVVALEDAAHPSPGLDPRDYDGIIVGSSVTFERHQRSVRRFVRAHLAALRSRPTAFFSVSGSAASPDLSGLTKAMRYIDDFLADTGWRPSLTQPVAGAIAYTKYGPLLRWVIKRITAKSGGPTDTSRDHEFTDWEQVREIADGLAALMPKREEAKAPALAT